MLVSLLLCMKILVVCLSFAFVEVSPTYVTTKFQLPPLKGGAPYHSHSASYR